MKVEEKEKIIRNLKKMLLMREFEMQNDEI